LSQRPFRWLSLPLMYIKADRLDDLLRHVFSELLKSPNRIKPRRGHATELAGVLLHLANPRARLSRTETKGRLFSARGELCWYLAKTKHVPFIRCSLPASRQYADDGRAIHARSGAGT